MQNEKEVLSIQDILTQKTERNLVVCSSDEASVVLHSLGRNENLSYFRKVKLCQDRVFSDHILIPIKEEYGDALLSVWTNIPVEYFHKAWLFTYNLEKEKMEPFAELSLHASGCSLTSFFLRLPHGYVREKLYLALYFHGSKWRDVPLWDRVSMEFLMLPLWKRERIWKAKLQDYTNNGIRFSHSDTGGFVLKKE